MAFEIERKFLVNKEKWNQLPKNKETIYRQGYILSDPEKTIRVRINDVEGFITLKGKTIGATRTEFEYSIPRQDAIELLDKFCSSELSKQRYEITHGGKLWEVDVFLGANEGLVVAEIELQSEDEEFEIPGWVLEEVTDDEKYYNANLAIKPFKYWK